MSRSVFFKIFCITLHLVSEQIRVYVFIYETLYKKPVPETPLVFEFGPYVSVVRCVYQCSIRTR